VEQFVGDALAGKGYDPAKAISVLKADGYKMGVTASSRRTARN